MHPVRPAAVAGHFYPADEAQLAAAVDGYLAAAVRRDPAPKALIAPHAGFVYSGPVAGSAYALLASAAAAISRVVLMGPAHHEFVRGFALSTADAFATPLGRVAVDREAVESLAAMADMEVQDTAHRHEHSLEVQLPFLQRLLPSFVIVPVLVGAADPEAAAAALESLWGGAETLIVVTSDLSHYHAYDLARRMDSRTTKAIEALDPLGIDVEGACGHVAVAGLLAVARRRGLGARTLDLRNSGDTAGPRDRVVGYGAYAFARGFAAASTG